MDTLTLARLKLKWRNGIAVDLFNGSNSETKRHRIDQIYLPLAPPKYIERMGTDD